MEIKWYTLVVLALLVGLFFALTFGAKRAKWNARWLANGAICIAISFVLCMIKLVQMPQGGVITPASMLPLIIFCMAAGPWRGLLVCCGFGLLQMLEDPYIIHPLQMLTDYPLAFGALALCCLVQQLPDRGAGSKIYWKLPAAVLIGYIGRYIMAVLSGAIFFSEYAGEQNAWIYSIVYNISYLGPDCLVCMLVAMIPGMPRIINMMKARMA